MFISLNIICLGIVFSEWILLEFAKLLESVNLSLLPNLGSFWSLFLQTFFSCLISFSSPSEVLMNDIYVRPFGRYFLTGS